jgi:sulfur carrier protein ThiS
MKVRLIFRREGRVTVYEGADGDTYADALLSLCVVPDTVLIFYNGRVLPEDKKIEEDAVEIVTTASAG